MKLWGIYLPIITIVAVLSGCAWEDNKTTKPTLREVSVGTYALKETSITLQKELPGRTKATMSAEVRPQVNGIIQGRLFEEGSLVKKGDVLYQIDSSSYQASVDEASATLKNAEVAVETARLKSERYNDLISVNGVSKQDAEDAKVAYLQALASVDEKRAALKSAQIDLEHTKIKAPISGRIGTSSVTAGTLVTASQTTALATIRTLDPIYVDIVQSSTQLLKLRQLLSQSGMKAGSKEVALKLEDGTLYAHKGVLQFQEIAVDESTGSVTLRATFPNPEGTLLPGMYVRTTIDEAIASDALLIPQQGVQRDTKGNASVYVVDSNNSVAKRTVIIDRAIKDRWLVTSGVQIGDHVVVEGTDKVRSGSKVKTTDISAQLDNQK